MSNLKINESRDRKSVDSNNNSIIRKSKISSSKSKVKSDTVNNSEKEKLSKASGEKS